MFDHRLNRHVKRVKDDTPKHGLIGVKYIQDCEYIASEPMDYVELTDWLKAMAHPTRLQILNLLRHGEVCVCHIENALNKRQAYISQQLMVLRETGLVESRKDGLQVYYTLSDPRIEALLAGICGPLQAQHEVINGCPCPSCEVISFAEIK
jgi:DNA-binding transcriptional ArsR family regulator